VETPYTAERSAPHLARRQLLQAGRVAGATFSIRPLGRPPLLWGGGTVSPKRGGILRVWGYDPPHFDPHLTINGKTHSTLSFVDSTLVRHKVGPEVQPGTFSVEPHVAERWEELDDTTYVFHLRRGVKWHHKPRSTVVSCGRGCEVHL
jgi:ABC-type transport system substrate-binding protein